MDYSKSNLGLNMAQVLLVFLRAHPNCSSHFLRTNCHKLLLKCATICTTGNIQHACNVRLICRHQRICSFAGSFNIPVESVVRHCFRQLSCDTVYMQPLVFRTNWLENTAFAKLHPSTYQLSLFATSHHRHRGWNYNIFNPTVNS